MKTIKRIAAILLVCVMALTVVGCHKKDEIAVTIGDVEFTSAYYMCALIDADIQAKEMVTESLTDEEKEAEEIHYYSKKVEDKEYVTWVKDKAIEELKKIAAYKTICNKNDIKISDEDTTYAESYVEYYWDANLSAYYEPNGVGENTYTQYLKDTYYSEKCFEHFYGKGGEKEVKSEDVKKAIYDNYLISDILTATYPENATDVDKQALKARIDKYAKELSSGKKTFEEVYNEYNNVKEESTSETVTDEKAPKDKYAQVIGAPNTKKASDYYDTVKGMKVGEAKVEETADGSGLYIFFKQDIKADDYYLESLDMEARHLLADEDFEKYIETYVKDLSVDINNFAVKQFKVEKIVTIEG